MSTDKESAQTLEAEVRHSAGLSRENVLQCATVIAAGSAAIAMSATALAADAGTARFPQQAAAYQTSPKNGQRCTDCALFIAPASASSWRRDQPGRLVQILRQEDLKAPAEGSLHAARRGNRHVGCRTQWSFLSLRNLTLYWPRYRSRHSPCRATRVRRASPVRPAPTVFLS